MNQFLGVSFSFLAMFFQILYLFFFGVGVYCLVLFIKLAHRGIKALDIYINEKTNK